MKHVATAFVWRFVNCFGDKQADVTLVFSVFLRRRTRLCTVLLWKNCVVRFAPPRPPWHRCPNRSSSCDRITPNSRRSTRTWRQERTRCSVRQRVIWWGWSACVQRDSLSLSFTAFLRRRGVCSRHDHEHRARVSEIPSAGLAGGARLMGTRIRQVHKHYTSAMVNWNYWQSFSVIQINLE